MVDMIKDMNKLSKFVREKRGERRIKWAFFISKNPNELQKLPMDF